MADRVSVIIGLNYLLYVSWYIVTNLPGEAKRTSIFKKERGDMRSKEYMEVFKELTQSGK